MKLLNFSIGQVQSVQVGSQVVRTAHIKAPVEQPWIITADGAAGDRRAVHPDKIYAFARTAYTHWGRHLEMDPEGWPDGFFGENLTLDVLDEEDVRVGDVFALGDEVQLVVAGARTPCLKLAWRLNQPRSFQKIFAQSRHTGAYFGIVATGTVRPGDAVRRVRHDPTMPSVADVCDYIGSHHPPPLEPLRRLLAFDGLSPTNRLLLGAKLDAAERGDAAAAGRWRGWRPFTIERIVEEARDIRSLHLRAADGGPLCAPRPGQFVSVRMTDEAGSPVTRCWSLSAFAHDLQEYRLTVRRQSGPGSGWVHRARVGETVSLRAPAGEFALDMGSFRPVVLVAAGIGITPLLAMLHAQLGRPGEPSVHLIYGVRSPADAAFRAELDALARAKPNFTLTYVYSQSDAGGRPAGRITSRLLIGLLGDLHIMLEGRRIGLAWHDADMYLCGPGEFCRTIKDELVGSGANPDHVHIELFAAPATQASDLDAAEVGFGRSGVTVRWTADEDLTLLEVAERAGIEIPSDCRAGACLTCRTMVVAGETTGDLGDGSTLPCIARPRTAELVLEA